jgi:hypothetical protein
MASISNDLTISEGPVTPVRGRVKGITGYTNNKGMMRVPIGWKIEDDEGQIHLIASRILRPRLLHIRIAKWRTKDKDNTDNSFKSR